MKTILMTLTVILISLSLLRCYFNGPDKTDTVLTINGEPVCIDEFYHIMSGLKSNVFSYFFQKYNIEGSEGFWTTSFNGETPLDFLINSTIETIKRIKIEQILINKYGITEDISYSGFLKDLLSENERRVKAVANNQPVYGPIQYDERVYYEYLLSERREKLKQLLSGKELMSGYKEIHNYYNENKLTKFRKPGNAKVEKISIYSYYGDENLSTDRISDADNIIKQVSQDLYAGKEFKKLADEYNNKGILSIDYEILIFDESTIKTYTYLFPAISAKIPDLTVNQISDIIKEGNTSSIIRILEKDPDMVIPLEEVTNQIKQELIDLKYEMKIQQLLNEAIVVFNEQIIGEISI